MSNLMLFNCMYMKIVINKWIPFRGFKAMCFYPFIFVRKGCNVNSTCINHERIHCVQQIELLFIFFYLWYIVEFVIRLFIYRFNTKQAYRNICFEKEAYTHQNDNLYTKLFRDNYDFLKYL